MRQLGPNREELEQSVHVLPENVYPRAIVGSRILVLGIMQLTHPTSSQHSAHSTPHPFIKRLTQTLLVQSISVPNLSSVLIYIGSISSEVCV